MDRGDPDDRPASRAASRRSRNTGRRGLRGRAQGLQRDDRPTAGRRCALCGHGRRVGCGGFRTRKRAGPGDTRGRAQRPGLRHRRRRCRDRPVRNARRSRRPRAADSSRAGRCHVGRLQRCHARPWPRDHRGSRLHDRSRRAHPRRRHRLSGARCRPVVRQPDLGRGGYRGRTVARGERPRERRSVLGNPRRRRKLRRRDRI